MWAADKAKMVSGRMRKAHSWPYQVPQKGPENTLGLSFCKLVLLKLETIYSLVGLRFLDVVYIPSGFQPGELLRLHFLVIALLSQLQVASSAETQITARMVCFLLNVIGHGILP